MRRPQLFLPLLLTFQLLLLISLLVLFGTYPPRHQLLAANPFTTSSPTSNDPLVSSAAAAAYTLWLTIASFMLLFSQFVLAQLADDGLNPVVATVINIMLFALWILSCTVFQSGLGFGGGKVWWLAHTCSTAWCNRARAALALSCIETMAVTSMCVWGVWGCMELWQTKGFRNGETAVLEQKDIEQDPFAVPRSELVI